MKIDIEKILLTPAMKHYLAGKLTPEQQISLSFHPTPMEVGKLTRMDNFASMTDNDFVHLLKTEPIDVSCKWITCGDENTGNLDEGLFYVIVNGRHRVTSAILRGLKHINASVKF